MEITNDLIRKAADGDNKSLNSIMSELTFNKDGQSKVRAIFIKYTKSHRYIELDDVQYYLDHVAWDTISRLWWTRSRDPKLFVGFVWRLVINRIFNQIRDYSGSRIKNKKGKEMYKCFVSFPGLSGFSDTINFVGCGNVKTYDPKDEHIDLCMRIDKVEKALKIHGDDRLIDVFKGLVRDGLRRVELARYHKVSTQTIRNDIDMIEAISVKVLNPA